MYRSDDELKLRQENERLAKQLFEQAAKHARELADAHAKLDNHTEELRTKVRDLEHSNNWLKRHSNIEKMLKVIGVGIGVVAVIWVLLSGIQACIDAQPPISGGIITDRYDDPAYTTPGYTTQVCSGNPSHCTPVYHPPVYHPEMWSIEISHNGRVRQVELTEEAWLTTEIGHSWCERPDMDCNFSRVERSR